jgi:hypothetical protein
MSAIGAVAIAKIQLSSEERAGKHEDGWEKLIIASALVQITVVFI